MVSLKKLAMKNYQAVIFDLDGTLVDSLTDIADSMNNILLRFGYPTYSYEAYKYFVGNGLKNLVYNCLPEGEKTEEKATHCLSAMMEEYGKHYADKTHLYNGISELLDFLVLNKMKLAVLSNKADEITKKICNRLLSQWHFDIILGATENFPRKPAPNAALYISKQLNINTEKFLYLGDTNIDMKTANASGMFSVGVTWGFRTRQELQEGGAKMIIDFPTDLLSLFNQDKFV